MRIYLVRHGESESNVNHELLQKLNDSDISITDTGRSQALKAGAWLKAHLHSRNPPAEKVILRHSPYTRTKQTMGYIRNTLGMKPQGGIVESITENALLREQTWGDFGGYSLEERAKLFPETHAHFQKEWEAGRSYWAARPNGESREAVAERMDKFIPEIHRDLESGVSDCVIVGHGVAHRLLIKQLTGMSVEDFDKEPNPGNCHIRMLEINNDKDVTDHGYIYAGDRMPARQTKGTQHR